MSNAEMGTILKTLRGEKTRREVANAVGVSVSALQMYENGERVPRDETKMKIAEYYHRSVESIFFRERPHETCG
jgi:transcriptional regulator with XRE-family HTH domain